MEKEIIDSILQIVPYSKIVHHIPGRIRLKISFAGLKILKNSDTIKALKSLPGVLDTRVNPIARSALIEYDQEKLSYDFWEMLGKLADNPGLQSEVRQNLEALSG